MSNAFSDADIAIVHDVAFRRGGGMRVVEGAARALDADLYVGMIQDIVRERSPVKINPLFDRIVANGTLRGLYFMRAFRNVPQLHKYDIVILSGCGTYWYLPEPDQRLIWYVHSVPQSYEHNGPLSYLSRALRSTTISHPDKLLANSKATREQIWTHWNRDADLVYPPVDLSAFDACEGRTGYHLMISRLTENKGVREVVEVYNNRTEQLVVLGDGPLASELRELAAENITIAGYVSEQRKQELLRDASAFILNSGNESFGIAVVEALASGTPVIAKNGGYTPFLIDHGRSGVLYEAGELAAALNEFSNTGVTASPSELASDAQEYGLKRFQSRIIESAHLLV